MQRLLLCTLKVLRVIHATVDTVLRSHPRFHRFARILVFITLLASLFSSLRSHPHFHRFAQKSKNHREHSTHHPNVPPRLRKRYTCRKSYQCGASVITKTQQKRVRKGTINQTEKPRGFWTPLTFFLELQLVKKQPQLPNLLLCFCLSTAVLKFYSYTCRNFYELGIGAEMQHWKLFDPSIRRPWNQWWWGAWCASRFWPYFWKGKFMMMQRLFSRCTYDGPAGKYLWSAKSINWRKDSSHVQL